MNHELLNKMNKKPEKDILKDALLQFNQLTGGKAKEMLNHGLNNKIDAQIEIKLGKERQVFLVEIKNELRQTSLPTILGRINTKDAHWLLVSKYIPQPIKQQLKEQGINYLEVAGNCYINAGGLFIYINDRSVSHSRKTPTGRFWKPAGLKFQFAILSDPGLLGQPYRTMAEAAGIALGNIGPLLDELQEKGYAKKNDDVWSIINKSALINQWVEMYPAILKPGLQKGRFKFLKPSMRQEWKSLNPRGFLWGGEPAGDLYTNFREPGSFIVYTNTPITEVMKELHLVPDPDGDVELRKQFWNNNFFQDKDNHVITPAVPPLLAYADLMNTVDSRNWEVAGRIKNKYLND
jgi:hypothetical protein